MPTSQILSTYENPIPTWKGPLENDVPEILTISGDPPPISGGDSNALPDFHCADTVSNDKGIIDMEKIDGTIFDDQD